jgi:single-stranded-DNA-specific exonuclease
MEKNWVWKPKPDATLVKALSEEINVSEPAASILVQRGINSYEVAKTFFRPAIEHLHDPFLMKDMDKAVNRLSEAIANEEKIMVYGDYDVDGTTSVALVVGFLREIHKNIEFYIPDRYAEGYGISELGVRFAAENGNTLMIALDCGIKAMDKVKIANELGLDMIICDHHLPGNEVPAAIAVLDPKQLDCEYPFKELSGCGVGFKLLQGFCLQQGIPLKQLYQYLDLVAVSIASDIVPIVGENRVLAYFGLKKLNAKPSPGLQAIKNNCAYKREFDISAVVFGIGPRINATGRIAHAKDSVNLLLSKGVEEANNFALMAESKNTERKGYDMTITSEALELIESAPNFADAYSTVLFKQDWHKGVIGIVASRCIDKYYRPTIILTESNGKATGSARSVAGFDVYKAIEECSDLLDQFGGHQFAAGLTMPLHNVPDFQKKFEEVVANTMLPEYRYPQIIIDADLNFDQISTSFYKILQQMAPFGPHNMPPVFQTPSVKSVYTPRLLKEEHLKLTLKQQGCAKTFDAIGFGMGEYYDMVSRGMPFSVVYAIEENTYMNKTSLQLLLKDIKFD